MSNNEPAAWFTTAIERGLQRLLCLSLPRAPAAELIVGTADTWADALWHGGMWIAEVDEQRIAVGFRTLARTRREWPLPSDLLAALPSRTARDPALPRRVLTDADIARNLERVNGICDQLAGRMRP